MDQLTALLTALLLVAGQCYAVAHSHPESGESFSAQDCLLCHAGADADDDCAAAATEIFQAPLSHLPLCAAPTQPTLAAYQPANARAPPLR